MAIRTIRRSGADGQTVGMSDAWALPETSGAVAPTGPAATPAEPERFPMGSEAGWRPDPTVPGQLRLWDGRHWTDHVRSLEVAAETAARPLGSVRTNTATRAWALMAQLTLGLWIVVSCVAMLWQIATLNTLEIWSLQPGDLHETEARDLLRQTILIVVAQILVHVVSVSFLLVWIGVARADRYVNRALLRGSTGGAVIGWLIPFVRVRLSRRTLTDLWHASNPANAGDGPRSAVRATPPLVLSYWLLRFFAPLVVLAVLLRSRDALGTVDRLRDSIFALVLGTGFLVAATVCLILVITRVTDQLRGRSAAPDTRAAPPVSASFTRT